MKSYNDGSTKHLPGIPTGKPKLRHSSWAKLLTQNKSKVCEERNAILPELQVNCRPVRLKVKRMRQSGYDPVEKFEKFLKQNDAETGNLKLQQGEDSEIEEELFGRILDEVGAMEGLTTNNTVIQTQDGELQIPKLSNKDERGDELNHLPSLTTNSPNKVEKTPGEEVYLRRQSKVKKDSRLSKTKDDIDWQNIFVNGGFRPCESRDLPTRGELNLLKYKTWDNEGPVHCIAKCAKYFGLDSEISKGKMVPEEEELQNRYISFSSTYKFDPLRVLHHRESFPPLQNSPETLKYSPENPSKWYHLCNSCTVLPATPTLGELTEMSVDGQTTDDEIGLPSESELEF